MRSFIRKILTSPIGVKARNFFGWRPAPISFSHLSKNNSVSDAFFWRVDHDFNTKFNFTDLLSLFTSNKMNITILEFFNHKNEFVKRINLANLEDLSQEILIDENLIGKKGYGTFYIYHTSNDKLYENITFSNRCYVGFSYRQNLFTYVHGNTYVKSKGILDSNTNGNMIQYSAMKKYSYTIQNTFKVFDKTELIFINPHDFIIDFDLNEKNYQMNPYEVKIIVFEENVAKIKSQSNFLRPLVFNYLNDYIDVYHS